MESARLGERSWFPRLQANAYYAHAAISPLSARVRQAYETVLDGYEQRGFEEWSRWVDQRLRLKAKLARLLGAAGDDLALVGSTSHAALAVAWCMPWRRGERVLVGRGEFPANVTPWQRAAEMFDLEVDWFDAAAFADASAGLAQLEAQLQRGVRLLAVSAVQFQTGLRMPLAKITELCHHYGTEVFVDAIQQLGVVPFDARALHVDYVAGGSHKWLMGPEGVGYLYVRPDRAEALVPRYAGWLSHVEPVGFLGQGAGHLRYDRPIRSTPDFLEIGSTNVAGCAALEAAVDTLLELDVTRIFAHVTEHLDRLEARLLELGFESRRSANPDLRSGTLAVIPPGGDSGAVRDQLVSRGIVVTAPDGLLRFAPHWPNSLEEVDRVVDVLTNSA